MIQILYLVAVAIGLYYFLINPHNYWARKNVETGFVYPIFGDAFFAFFGFESYPEGLIRMYNKVKNVRYSGGYLFLIPGLIVKSPELIKKICLKEFNHFLNHRFNIPNNVDEFLSRNLLILKGQNWKNMRSTLSPTFTSSKMKAMFIPVCQNAELFVRHFLEKNETFLELDMKNAFMKNTVDVIANTAFGIELNSLVDESNEFYKIGKEVHRFASRLKQKMIFIAYSACPKLSAFFKLTLSENPLRSIFTDLVKDNIRIREERNIKRSDMLGLLLEAKRGLIQDDKKNEIKENNFSIVEENLEMKTVKCQLTDVDIVANMFFFYIAGFESVSSSMGFMAYELAVNPDIQNKLVKEIDGNKPMSGLPSYETVMNLTYMDMVVSETLRKWPLVAITDRVVTKPFTIEPELPDEKPVHLDVDDMILISIFGIHRDPQHWKNPDMFDPERFSPENRQNIVPYTYLPFGVGARNCIGSRFALMGIKVLFFYLLSHFEIVPVEKTQIPLKLSKKQFNLFPEKGFMLGFKRRNI